MAKYATCQCQMFNDYKCDRMAQCTNMYMISHNLVNNVYKCDRMCILYKYAHDESQSNELCLPVSQKWFTDRQIPAWSQPEE